MSSAAVATFASVPASAAMAAAARAAAARLVWRWGGGAFAVCCPDSAAARRVTRRPGRAAAAGSSSDASTAPGSAASVSALDSSCSCMSSAASARETRGCQKAAGLMCQHLLRSASGPSSRLWLELKARWAFLQEHHTLVQALSLQAKEHQARSASCVVHLLAAQSWLPCRAVACPAGAACSCLPRLQQQRAPAHARLVQGVPLPHGAGPSHPEALHPRRLSQALGWERHASCQFFLAQGRVRSPAVCLSV